MSKHNKPWTFEPFELWSTQSWEIYDPNLARVVAVFYNEDEAEEYLSKVNFKQAEKKAKKAKKRAQHKEEEKDLW